MTPGLSAFVVGGDLPRVGIRAAESVLAVVGEDGWGSSGWSEGYEVTAPSGASSRPEWPLRRVKLPSIVASRTAVRIERNASNGAERVRDEEPIVTEELTEQSTTSVTAQGGPPWVSATWPIKVNAACPESELVSHAKVAVHDGSRRAPRAGRQCQVQSRRETIRVCR